MYMSHVNKYYNPCRIDRGQMPCGCLFDRTTRVIKIKIKPEPREDLVHEDALENLGLFVSVALGAVDVDVRGGDRGQLQLLHRADPVVRVQTEDLHVGAALGVASQRPPPRCATTAMGQRVSRAPSHSQGNGRGRTASV